MKTLPPTKHGFKIIPKNLSPNKDRATRVVIPSNSAIYRRLQKREQRQIVITTDYLAYIPRHIGSNPTPRYANAGRTAEQSASGGGSALYTHAGGAAEQLTGGGIAYTGRAAAEQPTFGGLQAGDYSSELDTAEAHGLHDLLDDAITQARRANALLRQQHEERFWAERRRMGGVERI